MEGPIELILGLYAQNMYVWSDRRKFEKKNRYFFDPKTYFFPKLLTLWSKILPKCALWDLNNNFLL